MAAGGPAPQARRRECISGRARASIWTMENQRWLGAMWLVGPTSPVADEVEYLYRSQSLVEGREVLGVGMRPPGAIFYYAVFQWLWEPGVAAAVMAEDRVSCDLICDGFHVHPALVRVAARAIRDRLLLITDRVDLPRDLVADDATG